MADREASVGLKVYLDDSAKDGFNQLTAQVDEFRKTFERAAESAVRGAENIGRATKDAFSSLADLREGSDKLARAVDRVADAAKGQQTHTSRAADALEQLADAASKATNAQKKLTEASNIATEAIKEQGKQSDWTAGALSRITRAIDFLDEAGEVAMPVIEASVATLQTMVTTAGDLEESLSGVVNATDATGEQADELRNRVLALSQSTTMTSEEIASAWDRLAEKSYNLNDILKTGLGESVIYLAQATKSEAIPATELMVAILKTFGIQAKEASTVADMLTLAYQRGIPEIDGLQEAVSNLSGYITALDIPLNDFLATLLYLVSTGFPDASSAADVLGSFLDNLVTPSEDAAKALTDLGLMAVNRTAPAIDDLIAKVKEMSEGAMELEVDSTVSSLMELYESAKDINALNTDKSFLSWALSVGALNSSFYDLNGNLKPVPELVELIATKLAGISDTAGRMTAIQDIFGVDENAAATLAAMSPQQAAHIGVQSSQIKQQAASPESIAMQSAADAMTNFNTKLDKLQQAFSNFMATVGTPVIDGLKPLLDTTSRLLTNFTQADPKVKAFVTTFLVIAAVVTPLVIIGGILAAIVTILGGPVVAVIGGVIAGILLLATGGGLVAAYWRPISATFNQIGAAAQRFIGPLIAFVMNNAFRTFAPIWQALGQIWQNTVVPALNVLMQAFMRLMPTFQLIAVIVGGLLTGIFNGLGLAVAIVGGIIGAVFIAAVHIITGVVNVVVGVVLFIQSLVQAFIALFTGNWQAANDAFTAAVQAFGTGLLQIFGGLFGGIISIIVGAFGAVIAFVWGFIEGIIGFFTHLWMVLVGNSIIPDMVRGIVQWILSLGPSILGWIGGFIGSFVGQIGNWASQVGAKAGELVTTVVGKITGMGSQLLTAGQNAIGMLTQGIKNAASGVVDAVSSVATNIKNFLGFSSPPKGGPLADSDEYMPNMMSMFSAGIDRQRPVLMSSIGDVAVGMAATFNTPALAQARSTQAMLNSLNGNMVVNLEVDGRRIEQVVVDRFTGAMKMNGLNRSWR